jgi:two-component system OmpR family response regulator
MKKKIVIIKNNLFSEFFLGANSKILVIEDNEASIHLIHAHLKRAGYRTVVSKTGFGGLSAARDAKPDLIVLDIMLPDMGGHKICRMIKFDKKLNHIPVIVWTSRDTDQDAETAKQCGADAFVVKTTRIEVLMDVIKKLLEKTEKKPEEETAPPQE